MRESLLSEQKAVTSGYTVTPARPTPRPDLLGAYHATLHRWWTLTAQGAAADVGEGQHVYQAIVRLIDEVGEPCATAQRRVWARDWHRETGICPFCGESGPYHDPGEPTS